MHTRTELLRNVELAAEFNLIVISDEIHAELIYAPHRHIPFASLSPDGRCIAHHDDHLRR